MKNSTTTTCPVAKFKRIATLTLLMFAIFYVALSQTKQIDSIKQCISKMQNDSSKANVLNDLADRLNITGNYDSALSYAMQSKTISEQLSYKRGLAASLNLCGLIFSNRGNYPLGLNYYFKALKINEELNNKNGIAKQLNNIGIVFMNKNDYAKAFDYCIRALKIHEKEGNKKQVANLLNNIGNMYAGQSDYKNANEYFLKSIKIYNELNDTQSIHAPLSNIGMINLIKGNYNESLNYFFKALSANGVDNKNEITLLYGNIGSAYMKQNKYNEAKKYFNKTISIAKEIGSLEDLKESNFNLSQICDKTGNKTLALDFYKQYIIYRDSLNNEENTKSIVRSEMNFDFDKKQAIMKSEQEKTEAISQAHDKLSKIVIGSISGILLIVIISSIFLYNRFRITHRQKKIIEKQKAEVDTQRHLADERRALAEEQKFVIEEKQKEIIASIRYAKRIQDSLLPTEDYINNTLNRLMKI